MKITDSNTVMWQVTDIPIEQQKYGALYEVIDTESVETEFRWARGEHSFDEIALDE